MPLDELLVALGFDYDEEGLKEFQKELDSTLNLVKKLATVLVAGTTAVVGFTIATTRASDEQGKLANEIGISVGQLDALQFAQERAGGTSDGLSSSLQQLSVRIGEAARGTGSGLEAFGLLGIQIAKANGELKDTDEILLEVSNRFDQFSKSQQLEIADKLGLRDSIRLLQIGSDGIQELVAEAELLGTTTREDARLAEEFQDSLVDIWRVIKQVSRVIARSLVPNLEDLADDFTEWWKINRDIIEQRIPEFIEKAAFAIKILTAATVGFIAVKFITTLTILLTLMRALTGATLLMNAAMLLLPALIAVVLTAIALLAQDAKVFFEGGESFIGNMLQKYPQWADEIKTVALLFKGISAITEVIFDGWSKIFQLFTRDLGAGSFRQVLNQLKKDIDIFVDNIFNRFTTGFDDLKENIKNAFSLDNLKDTVFGIFGGDDVSTSPDVGQRLSRDVSTTNNNAVGTTIQGGVNIQVSGNESPELTAAAIRRELSNMTEQTAIDLNSPVRL